MVVRSRVIGLTLGALLAIGLTAACGGVSSAARSAEDGNCQPRIAPVDPLANPVAVCAASTLDQWHAQRSMGIGQQLNVSSTDFALPLKALEPSTPALIGFDLEELHDAIEAGNDPSDELIARAKAGALLTATWHARNPQTGGNFDDRSWTDTAQLLNAKSPSSTAFWANWDKQLRNLKRFQSAGVAVIVSPMHEAGGDWFWWGGTKPVVYKQIWAQMQARASAAGVHNLLWAFAAAPKTRKEIVNPLALLPHAVDVVGIDTYQQTRTNPVPAVDITDYKSLAARAPRMAITEVGPHGSDGSWTPSVITSTVKANNLSPVYARLWFDDGDGRKQIASLKGGKEWLAGCPQGLCSLK
ncbi:MAG: glycosyl hydrolase [Actinomycetota bacterium]|nr:glycosyl hydrolase [Actinomycetota bacterium]